MATQDHQGHDENQGPDSARGDEPATRNGGDLAAGPAVIGTNDPLIASGPTAAIAEKEPDSTMVIKTSRIEEGGRGAMPGVLVVPVEFDPTSQDRPDAEKAKAGDKGKADTEKGKANGRKGEERPDAQAGDSHAKPRPEHHDRDPSHDHGGWKPSLKAPSFTRTLVFSAILASVCGLVGAWGYSYFFGSSKSEDQKSSSGQKSSSKRSDSGGGSDSSGKGSTSKPGAGSEPKTGGES